MKICSKCGIEKPDIEFYKNKAKKDGLEYICKLCKKDYYLENIDRIKEYKKQYNIEHVDELKEYRQTEQGKLAKQISNAKIYATEIGKLKQRARYLAAKFIPLTTNCSECNSTLRIQRHHPDYDQPLVVRQLCEKCHQQYHLNNIVE